MLITARIFAALSTAFAVACWVVWIGAGRFNVLHLGFEFVGVVGALLFYLAALASVSALLIIFARILLGGPKDGNAPVVQASFAALLLLIAAFVVV